MRLAGYGSHIYLSWPQKLISCKCFSGSLDILLTDTWNPVGGERQWRNQNAIKIGAEVKCFFLILGWSDNNKLYSDELLLPWQEFWQDGFQVWAFWGVRSTCACLAGIWPGGDVRARHIDKRIRSQMHFKRSKMIPLKYNLCTSHTSLILFFRARPKPGG